MPSTMSIRAPSPRLFTILLPMKPAIRPSTIHASNDITDLLSRLIWEALGLPPLSDSNSIREGSPAEIAPKLLLCDHHRNTSILGPALVGGIACNGVLSAITLRCEAVGRDPLADQFGHGGVGTIPGQLEIAVG